MGLATTGMAGTLFQSTPPARGATRNDSSIGGRNHNFNPRPPRGGRRYHRCRRHTGHGHFNPRPPRGGATTASPSPAAHTPNFNPRPPRGGRLLQDSPISLAKKFQSTPPARGATRDGRTSRPNRGISIHAPREGGDRGRYVLQGDAGAISIHAPREGGDRTFSTCWEISGISIHAPREGGDRKTQAVTETKIEISIHAPREGGDYE